MKQKNTVHMFERHEYHDEGRIRTEATTVTRGRVERSAKGTKVRMAQSVNLTGYTGTGRDVRPIPTPKTTKAVRFNGKTYHIPKNIAG